MLRPVVGRYLALLRSRALQATRPKPAPMRPVWPAVVAASLTHKRDEPRGASKQSTCSPHASSPKPGAPPAQPPRTHTRRAQCRQNNAPQTRRWHSLDRTPATRSTKRPTRPMRPRGPNDIDERTLRTKRKTSRLAPHRHTDHQHTVWFLCRLAAAGPLSGTPI